MGGMSESPERSFLERLKLEDAFEHETLRGEQLQGVRLSGKEFYRCVFEGAHLQETRWSDVRLEDCVFRDCDLTRANVAGLKLREVRFEGCKLMGIDWSDVAPNPELHFEDCNLRYGSFVGLSLRRTTFARCAAHEVNFTDTDLTESDFTGTDLSGSNFRGCTLTKADFRGAIAAFLDPARNVFKGTRISVETAVLAATSLGMRVEGHTDSEGPAPSDRRSRARKK